MASIDDVIIRLKMQLASWTYFHEVLGALEDQPYRTILNAWSGLRARYDLQRDEQGRYKLPPPMQGADKATHEAQ